MMRHLPLGRFFMACSPSARSSCPNSSVTLLNYIGLYAIVAVGLVLLTGVGGLTSFGQAAFVGLGAYTTAWLTTVHGFSPWLTLLIGLAITAAVALFSASSRCAWAAITCRSAPLPGASASTSCSAISSSSAAIPASWRDSDRFLVRPGAEVQPFLLLPDLDRVLLAILALQQSARLTRWGAPFARSRAAR
jgi:branched-subunit amino acid ABC-type transport system permease component